MAKSKPKCNYDFHSDLCLDFDGLFDNDFRRGSSTLGSVLGSSVGSVLGSVLGSAASGLFSRFFNMVIRLFRSSRNCVASGPYIEFHWLFNNDILFCLSSVLWLPSGLYIDIRIDIFFLSSLSWAAFTFDINTVELYSQLLWNGTENMKKKYWNLGEIWRCHRSRTIMSMQFSRIGIEKIVDMNSPLLSKYCSRENDFQYVAPKPLIVSEKYTSNTMEKEKQTKLKHLSGN